MCMPSNLTIRDSVTNAYSKVVGKFSDPHPKEWEYYYEEVN